MPTEQELNIRRLEMKMLPKRSVFSVFCIGTGHRKDEVNNTIAALGKACCPPGGGHDQEENYKIVNDGPTGVLGNLQGWGMNDALERTVEAIRAARPTVVNMTGHSRGAILCHMIAYRLFRERGLRDLHINMIVLDPVHQSKLKHEGAEILDDNDLLSYHAIIMEHEDKKIAGNAAFPFKFVTAPGAVGQRMHYINLPGKHGSASQCETSPIGKVGYHLIAQYMRARGTRFSDAVPTPLDMCEHFASIHALNPSKDGGTTRTMFDDGGYSTIHDVAKVGVHTTRMRSNAVAQAMQLNTRTVQRPGHKVLPTRPVTPYLFNQEHAFYFKLVCPYFFQILANAPARTRVDMHRWHQDFATLGKRPALASTSGLLLEQMRPLSI